MSHQADIEEVKREILGHINNGLPEDSIVKAMKHSFPWVEEGQIHHFVFSCRQRYVAFIKGDIANYIEAGYNHEDILNLINRAYKGQDPEDIRGLIKKVSVEIDIIKFTTESKTWGEAINYIQQKHQMEVVQITCLIRNLVDQGRMQQELIYTARKHHEQNNSSQQT